MSMSLRSHLVTGVAAVATTALIASPTTMSPTPSIQASERAVTARVDLAASVKPIIREPLRPEEIATARAAISRIDPESTFATAALAPAAQNAASDWLIGAYQWLQYWVDYGVELADYVLQFLPFGYFIGDQITIFYDFLITPIADSVVYGLMVPVLNDPLNLSAWVDGLVNVGQTAITAAINTGIVEFNYFFGWLIPPLPPLPIPPFPLAAVQTVEPLATVEAASLLSATLEEVADEKVGTEIDAEGADGDVTDAEGTDITTPEVVTEPEVVTAPEVVTEPEVVTTPEVVTEPEVVVDETTVVTTPEVVTPEPDDETIDATTPIKATPVKSSLGTVSAQGEVRGGATTSAADTKPDAETTSGKDKDKDKDKDKPASVSTPSSAGSAPTGTNDKTDSTTDSGKTEKNTAASE